MRVTKTSTVTIRDVAGKSGVSVTTVSMVLNDAPLARHIPLTTRNRVKRAAKDLGYRPNLFARSLRSNRSQTLGVVVFDITDPYCTQILRGIEDSLYHSGYLPILTDIQNQRARFQRCVELLLERRVEGVIAIANPLYLESDLLQDFAHREVPTVIIGRQLGEDSLSSVVVDNQAGTFAALEHLYKLGHRKIAFIRGPKALADSAPRWKGLCDFARQAGLKIDPKLVVEIQGGNSSYPVGVELTQELLSLGRPFTALMTFDDLTAFAAIGCLTKAGRRVPEDVSVVGFDDIPGAAFYNPPLTTVHQHLEMQGSLGAEIIRDLIHARNSNQNVKPLRRRVVPRLVVRQSTAPPQPPQA
ncbi:MAG TPA: LacI family DNA-binding transcriptional regulator [Terriglobales bacterium]|jgi:LacI family transcriptional regulator|nr:LacI family DNA-binding transcriptional regulator [Terriglobales bacterium]